MSRFITPPFLNPGDKIAIITPATVVRQEYIAGGMEVIKAHGYCPVLMPNVTTGGDGRFAGSEQVRLEDLLTAISDPEIKCIWAGRGGYGSAQLIGKVPLSAVTLHPKWMVGFSDICALHAMMLRAGIRALHAPMMRRLADFPDDDITRSIFSLLKGFSSLETEGCIHPLQQNGEASGVLVGGNISVLGDLAATPFDPFAVIGDEPFILLLEDVGESLSRLQRRLYRLRLAGVMNRAAGIVIGSFRECPGGVNFNTPEEMIADLLKEWNVTCPVTYQFPVGHDDCNYPLVIGAMTSLQVTPAYALLSQS